MDMGVVLQGSSPGVKDTEEPWEISPDVMLIGGKFFDRLRGGLKQCRVSDALVFADKTTQVLWHREGEKEMMSGELAVDLFFQPLSGLMLLASGAVPIATGAIEFMGPAARFALIKGQAAGFGATGSESIDGFAVCFRHQVGVALEVLRAEGAKDFIDGGHDRVPPSRD